MASKKHQRIQKLIWLHALLRNAEDVMGDPSHTSNNDIVISAGNAGVAIDLINGLLAEDGVVGLPANSKVNE